MAALNAHSNKNNFNILHWWCWLTFGWVAAYWMDVCGWAWFGVYVNLSVPTPLGWMICCGALTYQIYWMSNINMSYLRKCSWIYRLIRNCFVSMLFFPVLCRFDTKVFVFFSHGTRWIFVLCISRLLRFSFSFREIVYDARANGAR